MTTNMRILSALAILASGIGGFALGTTGSQVKLTQSASETPTIPMPMWQPGKEHKWLASLEGSYTAKMRGVLGESQATSRVETVHGGLWSISHFESSVMGQPFTGMEILGFDPLKKKYVAVWADSMTPKLLTMEGDYEAESKTLTMKGLAVGMDGEKAEMVNITKYTDDGMIFTMNIEGESAPTTIIEYQRKK